VVVLTAGPAAAMPYFSGPITGAQSMAQAA
jgi:hypothetical protein